MKRDGRAVVRIVVALVFWCCGEAAHADGVAFRYRFDRDLTMGYRWVTRSRWPDETGARAVREGLESKEFQVSCLGRDRGGSVVETRLTAGLYSTDGRLPAACPLRQETWTVMDSGHPADSVLLRFFPIAFPDRPLQRSDRFTTRSTMGCQTMIIEYQLVALDATLPGRPGALALFEGWIQGPEVSEAGPPITGGATVWFDAARGRVVKAQLECLRGSLDGTDSRSAHVRISMDLLPIPEDGARRPE